MGISYGANYHYDTNEYNLETMWCSGFDFPHWWQVDLGRTIYGVCKFIFNPIEEMHVYVKDYELSYSLDGLNFTKIYSSTYIPDHEIGITSHNYKILQDEECEFTPVNLRYFRITILNSYDTRGYKWAGLTNCLLYSLVNRCLILKESDNYIYDNILENKLITLEQWNSYTKEEKINLFETSFKFGVANLSKFKSFNNFKVFIKEDT